MICSSIPTCIDIGATAGSNILYSARVFGPFDITRDGKSLSSDPSFARAGVRKLLKWFLLHPGESIAAPSLCVMLWPDRSPTLGLNRLHALMHYLRRLLEPELGRRQSSTFIRTDGDGRYYFEFAGCWWVDTFDVGWLGVSGQAAERENDLSSAVGFYERLLGYYERSFLPEDVFDATFDGVRNSVEVAHREAEIRLLHLYLRLDQAHKALMLALSITERDPFCEEAFSAIAEVNLRQGDFVTARSQLASYASVLERELGVRPGPAVQRLWGEAADQERGLRAAIQRNDTGDLKPAGAGSQSRMGSEGLSIC